MLWSPRISARIRDWPSRVAILAGTATALVLAVSPAALAHAVLVSANPSPGADLQDVPAVVTLVFDEPLVATLSRATVTSPAGRAFTSTVSGKTMHVRMSGRAVGVYRVVWKTVSEVDGHVIEGGFRFGVGVQVKGAAVTAPSPGGGDIVLSFLRGIEYTLVLLACGMALLLRLGRRLPLRQPYLPVALALLLSGVVVVGAEVSVAGSGLSVGRAVDYLTNGLTGEARVTRVVLEVALVAVARWGKRFLALPLVGIIGAIAVAGHGADVEPAWQGMAVNAAHLAAAGLWAGGILALALVRLQGQWPKVGRELLAGFSRVAPWAFAASVGLGAVQAYELLGSPQPVLHTSYGLTLVVKSVAVLAMVPLSWLAWRRAQEHLRGEAVLALVVVAAAAALAAFPVVPKEAREAAEEATAAATQRVSAFPQPGDLTIGGRAGRAMVGLTLHPGKPGANTVTVFLATPATRSTRARVDVGGDSVELRACGVRCRTGTVRLSGRQTLTVHVGGQGSTSYHLPALPAPDGAALVAAAERRMDALHSYRVGENLSGFRSRYRYATPHRLFVRTWFGAGPQDTLWLGRRLFKRSKSTGAWRLETKGQLAPVPYYPWYPFRPLVDAHVIGATYIRGVRVKVISTFGGHGKDPESLWFTLYVDPATHTVLRSRMWAPNHFMIDRYRALNAPARFPSPGSGAR
jgi:copper transport protein